MLLVKSNTESYMHDRAERLKKRKKKGKGIKDSTDKDEDDDIQEESEEGKQCGHVRAGLHSEFPFENGLSEKAHQWLANHREYPCHTDISHHFGKKILSDDGTLNRQALSQKVFNNETERKILEGILHPAVRLSMHKAVENVRSPYCILVIPLLVETGFPDLVDRVLVVTADLDRRKDWIKQRSRLNNDQIKSIMAAQASDEERSKIADDVIENNGSLESLFLKVEELDQKYRS